MVVLSLLVLAASGWASSDPRLPQGKAVYTQACAQCHGDEGRGNPDWESEVRPVEFTDCGTTAEPSEFWESIVRRGGRAHGLSSVMPGFEEAYTPEETSAVVAYLRTFCPTADSYPPGDLNFRRLLKTGKAFPEAEWVIRLSDGLSGSSREGELEIAYENRLGPRFQYEIEAPLRYVSPGGEANGVGDLFLAGKQVLHFDVARRQILSAGLGVSLPLGDEEKGLGTGAWSFVPFLTYGKAWGKTIVQARVAGEISSNPNEAPHQVAYAAGLSRALGPHRTAWVPAVELTGDVETATGEHRYAAWFETSKTLTRLGHVAAAVGVRVPLRPRSDPASLEMYLLWDFGDGPFWRGW